MYQRFFAFFPGYRTCAFARTRNTSHAYLVAVGRYYFHNIVFFKFTVYFAHSYRQKAYCCLAHKSVVCAAVYANFTFGETFAVRYPFLDTGYGFWRRHETGTHNIQSECYSKKYIVFFTVGYYYFRAFFGYF